MGCPGAVHVATARDQPLRHPASVARNWAHVALAVAGPGETPLSPVRLGSVQHHPRILPTRVCWIATWGRAPSKMAPTTSPGSTRASRTGGLYALTIGTCIYVVCVCVLVPLWVTRGPGAGKTRLSSIRDRGPHTSIPSTKIWANSNKWWKDLKRLAGCAASPGEGLAEGAAHGAVLRRPLGRWGAAHRWRCCSGQRRGSHLNADRAAA